MSSTAADTSREQEEDRRTSAFRLTIKSFTSQWFLVPQGMGILAVVLHQLHYQFYGLVRISQIFWVLTIVLLLLFLGLYGLRIWMYPKEIKRALSMEILETSCLSCISITFTTIIQMIALNLTRDWSLRWGMVAWVMWWVNAAIAFAACVGIPYVYTKLEAPGIDWVPPGMLLPLIAALTVAAGGGVVCRYGEIEAELQVPVIIVSYLFVGLALPLSVVVDAVFLARLMDNHFPVKEKVYQLMILCGPLGQGSFAMQILGQCVQRGAFATYNSSPFLSAQGAMTVSISSQFLGLITWGYGIFWWAFACIAIVHFLISSPKELLQLGQTLTAWSLIFPVGVFTNAAIELGVILNSKAFWVFSAILTVILVVEWLVVAGATLLGVFNGKLLGRGIAEQKKRGEQDKQQKEDVVQGSGNGRYSGLNSGLRHREGQ